MEGVVWRKLCRYRYWSHWGRVSKPSRSWPHGETQRVDTEARRAAEGVKMQDFSNFLAGCILGESFNARRGGTDNGGPSISKRAAALLVDCQPPVDLLIAASLPLIEVADELKRRSTSTKSLCTLKSVPKTGGKPAGRRPPGAGASPVSQPAECPTWPGAEPSLLHPARGQEGWSSLPRRMP